MRFRGHFGARGSPQQIIGPCRRLAPGRWLRRYPECHNLAQLLGEPAVSPSPGAKGWDGALEA